MLILDEPALDALDCKLGFKDVERLIGELANRLAEGVREYVCEVQQYGVFLSHIQFSLFNYHCRSPWFYSECWRVSSASALLCYASVDVLDY
jgi:hypothetical protein